MDNLGADSNTSRQTILESMFAHLFDTYGPQHWWPGHTATEVVIGAILTQNTAWSNVVRAISALKDAGALSWTALRDLPQERLEQLVRPSGTFRVKAKRLRTFVDRLWGAHGGSLEDLLDGPIEKARGRLLSIPGIGPETADAILLYAGKRPTFVVDAYTIRILRRHGMIGSDADYEFVRRLFQSTMPCRVKLYNEYHALLVAVGKRHCRVRPLCDGCPLACFPHDASL